MMIGALARAGGVGVETVRYYQRRGLIGEPEKSGGVRRYDAEAVRRLRFIRAAQTAGFTLAQIAELIELDAGQDRERARALAVARIAAIDEEIARLTGARDALARLASTCAAGTGAGCPILEAFEP
ncbi:MerR family transcriptional regulator [Sphingomonas sp.]|uniref:MerR family transcriptional regulator n=1 Tax=Sphingomonas sp. TaxID=28214 RepID=UPI0025D50852|nr:MerR family transcriptional regulator [Sphingomonas sp.]